MLMINSEVYRNNVEDILYKKKTNCLYNTLDKI